MKKLRLFLPLIAILLAALACNFPGQAVTQPTADIPPLELTMTALFKTAAALPPTNTPPPFPSPTNTSPPVATSTPPPQPLPSATSQPPLPPNHRRRRPRPPQPPPTATQVPVRPGARVEAAFMNPAPTIDGDWSEWKTVAKEYPATNVVCGKSNWVNEDDLAGSYYVGWDQTYLYIAAKVRDDKYVQVSQGENIFEGDSLEMILDLDLLGDFYSTNLSRDDYQIGIAAGRPTIARRQPGGLSVVPLRQNRQAQRGDHGRAVSRARSTASRRPSPGRFSALPRIRACALALPSRSPTTTHPAAPPSKAWFPARPRASWPTPPPGEK